MRSPFPGMDPYLEASWSDVHTSLLVSARRAIQKQLPPGLRAVVEKDVRLESDVPEDSASYRPDLAVNEIRPSVLQGLGPATPGGGTALAEPYLLRIAEPPRPTRWLQVIDTESHNRVVTVLEFLSPSNKLPGQQNARYRQKLRDMSDAGVSVVEVDLIRSVGRGRLDFDTTDLPLELRATYYSSVRPALDPTALAIYPHPLRERLRPFAFPLREGDRPIVLDLQPVIDQVYEDGQYFRYIDYTKPPDPPLSPVDAAWAAELLKSQRPTG